MMLRSEEQAKLAELHGLGGGMLARYRELLDDVPHRVTPFLQAVVERRSELVERIAAAEAARADLPSAADLEINELRAMGDRVLAAMFGEATLYQRIRRAEQEWGALLGEATDLDWRGDERELLADLQSESRESLQLLKALKEDP